MTRWMRTILPVLLLLTGSRAQQREEVPFPTDRSTILRKEGVVYYVEGRRKIPWGCEISVQKDVYIKGRGSDAVLEVEGSLQAHGVDTREIIVEGLVIEPSERFEDIHLDMVILRDGGGLITAKDKPVKGRIFVDNTTVTNGAKIELDIYKGEVDLQDVSSHDPVRIRGPVEEGKRSSLLKLNVIGSDFSNGLFVTGGRDVTIRISRMAGSSSEFVDCLDLTFDGNKVECETLVFRQAETGRFSKTKLQKCDIYSNKLVFDAPLRKGRPERCSLDKCWFKGLTREKEIRERVISDARSNEQSGVEAVFRKINEKPLELAGAKVR